MSPTAVLPGAIRPNAAVDGWTATKALGSISVLALLAGVALMLPAGL